MQEASEAPVALQLWDGEWATLHFMSASRILGLLEASFRTHPLVDDPQMQKLWQGFETWLVRQFPQASRIVSPHNDPIADTPEEYQTFLRSLGYEPIAKAAFGKPIKK